jgi:transposase
MLTTWKFRIKDSGSEGTNLAKMARSVNKVWNLCKETQVKALEDSAIKKITDSKTGQEKEIRNYISSFELDKLFSGKAKEYGLHSQTLQAVSKEYATRVRQFGKTLRWRGRKALGWIPFKASAIKVKNGKIIYCKKEFGFWESRKIPEDAVIKIGTFSQDARKRWYISITFESNLLVQKKGTEELGGDIGIRTLLTLSDGSKVERPNLRHSFLDKLKRLEKTRKYARRRQAANKKYGKLPKEKQCKNLCAKVGNTRQDYLHKESTKLISRIETLVIGDVPCKLMNRSKNLSGISLDSGIGSFKKMLHFKAERAGATYSEISERDSTQTCHSCGYKHPRESRIGLGVRSWCCPNCRVQNDRDVNAARNILVSYQHLFRMGHHTPTCGEKKSMIFSLLSKESLASKHASV